MERAALEATATPPPQAPSHAPGSADGRKWYVEYVVHANAAITLLGWVRYWSRRRWMPYHGQVAGLRWHELGPSLQLLFLTMSRTASTACALCALSTVTLFREGGSRATRRRALQLQLALVHGHRRDGLAPAPLLRCEHALEGVHGERGLYSGCTAAGAGVIWSKSLAYLAPQDGCHSCIEDTTTLACNDSHIVKIRHIA
jgi:hypothetical protein